MEDEQKNFCKVAVFLNFAFTTNEVINSRMKLNRPNSRKFLTSSNVSFEENIANLAKNFSAIFGGIILFFHILFPFSSLSDINNFSLVENNACKTIPMLFPSESFCQLHKGAALLVKLT